MFDTIKKYEIIPDPPQPISWEEYKEKSITEYKALLDSTEKRMKWLFKGSLNEILLFFQEHEEL